MNKELNIQKNIFIIGIPLSIIALMVLISKSSIFILNPSELSIGITFDLLLTVPLVYLLLIRNTKIPSTTAVPLLILGAFICSQILPLEHHYFLNLFKNWVFPIIELSIFSYVLYNVAKSVKQYRVNKTTSFDFFTTLKNTCYETLPKAFVIPVITEIAVFYYGFLYWKKRELKENEFSYHKESGTIAVLVIVIFLVAIETFVFHFLLIKWNHTFAWVFTLLSIYSGVQIFGFLRSMYKRPISIENNRIYIFVMESCRKPQLT